MRRVPLIYVKDGDNYALIASAGRIGPPSRLVAEPASAAQASVDLRGESIAVTASEATPELRERLWPAFTAIYPSYDKYLETLDKIEGFGTDVLDFVKGIPDRAGAIVSSGPPPDVVIIELSEDGKVTGATLAPGSGNILVDILEGVQRLEDRSAPVVDLTGLHQDIDAIVREHVDAAVARILAAYVPPGPPGGLTPHRRAAAGPPG